MSSKADKKRRHRKARAGRDEQTAATEDAPAVVDIPRHEVVRPTPERMRHGRVQVPTGRDRHDLPAHDQHHDAIAKLHTARKITDEQEMGARKWQWLRYRLEQELGVDRGRSCLDMDQGGYDATEGDPAFMRRWRELEAALGWVKVGALDHTCIQGRAPGNLPLLGAALDMVYETA